MLNRLILLIYHASYNLKRTEIRFIADSLHPDIAVHAINFLQICYGFQLSTAVSKLGITELIFVDLGMKVNSQYYRDVLLSQQMLPAIKNVAGDMFVFQQDNAPSHCAKDTTELLQQEMPDLWPPVATKQPRPVSSGL